MEQALPIVALVISAASLGVTAWIAFVQRRSGGLMQNLSSLAGLDLRLGTDPNLMRFHGITEPPADILQEHGVTPEELGYLVSNFRIGAVYYRSMRDWQLSTYRVDMCLAPATRRAWPLVRRFLDDEPYRQTLDKLFSEPSE